MKKLTILILLCTQLIILFFTSCVHVEETLYLREAEVTGPIMPAPVHLTDSTDAPSFTISPKLSYNTKDILTGDIKQRTRYFELDTFFIPSEKSLTWNVTTVLAGIDMDLVLSRSFAIFFGVNYSTANNYNEWGGNVGIGLFGYGNGTAFRFDAGLQIQTMHYDVYTTLHRVETSNFSGKREYILFFHDLGKSTHFDPFFNFTFNTAHKNWPVNLFINAGYSIQTLFNFEPKTSYSSFGSYTRTDLRGSSRAGFFTFMPGIYLFWGESYRILLGAHFYLETQIEDAKPKTFILPMIQFDFGL
jgi:hypothetical protein